MEKIQNTQAFFNAITQKRYADKAIAGTMAGTGLYMTASSVGGAISSAAIPQLFGHAVPILAGTKLAAFLGLSTKFSMLAFFGALNPALLVASPLAAACLSYALKKTKGLTDKDMTYWSGTNEMADFVSAMVFTPVFIERKDKKQLIKWRNVSEIMVGDYGFSEEFAESFVEEHKKMSLPKMAKEVENIYP